MTARFHEPPTKWQEVHAGYAAPVVAATKRLRELVVQALPDCTEVVQGARMMGYAQYWLENRNDVMAMISPEDTHVKLYVHHVKKDATGRLKVEGTGKNARHLKLPIAETWNDEAILGLLQQVIEARG